MNLQPSGSEHYSNLNIEEGRDLSVSQDNISNSSRWNGSIITCCCPRTYSDSVKTVVNMSLNSLGFLAFGTLAITSFFWKDSISNSQKIIVVASTVSVIATAAIGRIISFGIEHYTQSHQ